MVDDSTAALLPERLARVEMWSGLPFFTIRKAPTSMYGVKCTDLARSGVIVIELMIALHFLCRSAGMMTLKPVVWIFAVELSCFATAFAMSMSAPAGLPLTIDSIGGYVVSTQ